MIELSSNNRDVVIKCNALVFSFEEEDPYYEECRLEILEELKELEGE